MTAEIVETTDRWTPIRRGMFYGSAACCRATLCRLVAYDQATVEARQLADHLGPGWEPRVWENLGWHYRVTLTSGEDKIEVSADTKGSHTRGGWEVTGYGASFNHQEWQRDKTPEGAVVKVIAVIRAQMDALGAVLASAQTLALESPTPASEEVRGG